MAAAAGSAASAAAAAGALGPLADMRRVVLDADVYPPSEDTWLLADVLQAELAAWGREAAGGSGGAGAAADLAAAGPTAAMAAGAAAAAVGAPSPGPGSGPGGPALCLELGTGSGYVLTSLARMLAPTGAQCIGVDLNPAAAACTRATAAAHGLLPRVEVAQMDLTRGFGRRLDGCVDLLVFNPPYVPTGDDEVARGGLAAAWAGGARGRAVVDRLLPHVARLLAPGGRFYLIALPQNDVPELLAALAAQGLAAGRVGGRRADEEDLCVLRACKPRVDPVVGVR